MNNSFFLSLSLSFFFSLSISISFQYNIHAQCTAPARVERATALDCVAVSQSCASQRHPAWLCEPLIRSLVRQPPRSLPLTGLLSLGGVGFFSWVIGSETAVVGPDVAIDTGTGMADTDSHLSLSIAPFVCQFIPAVVIKMCFRSPWFRACVLFAERAPFRAPHACFETILASQESPREVSWVRRCFTDSEQVLVLTRHEDPCLLVPASKLTRPSLDCLHCWHETLLLCGSAVPARRPMSS